MKGRIGVDASTMEAKNAGAAQGLSCSCDTGPKCSREIAGAMAQAESGIETSHLAEGSMALSW